MESRRNGPQLSSRHDDDDDYVALAGNRALVNLLHVGQAPFQTYWTPALAKS